MASFESSAQSTGQGAQEAQETKKINVGRTERNASLAGGAALLMTGISQLRKRRVLSGLALLTAGGMVYYRGKTGHCNMYEALGINTAGSADVGVHLEKTMTVNKPLQEVYQFWRRLENMPLFMRHLDSVRMTGERTSHWSASGPAGMRVEWDAEIIEDSANRISWRSIGDAQVPNQGVVEFSDAPGGRGTEVKVRIFFHPPGGAAGKAAAKVVNAITAQTIEEDLKRFKQIMETGETSTARFAAGQHPRPSRSFMPAGGAVDVR